LFTFVGDKLPSLDCGDVKDVGDRSLSDFNVVKLVDLKLNPSFVPKSLLLDDFGGEIDAISS